jgi:hypothetical protein
MLPASSAFAGTVRYAAPGAAGAEPCNPAPCSLVQAVNGASDTDQVIVTPGHYTEGGELDLNHAVDVGGQAGAAVPTVELGFKSIRVENPGAVLHDIRIELPGPAMAYALLLETGTVERAYVSSGELTAGSCAVTAGTLRDGVCWRASGGVGGLTMYGGEPASFQATLRNVTASSTLVVAAGGASLTVDAVNVIAQSVAPGDHDLNMDVGVGSSATATFSHSNYSTVDTSLSAGTNFTYTQPGTNGNQTAEPLFVNSAAEDLHQLAGSPTIDAGLSDPLIGATDLDRNPRSAPPCIGGTPIPDIGAYETAPTVACPKPPNGFGFGKVKRNRKKGTAKLAVSLPGAGTLSLFGKGVVSQTASGAGTVNLLVKAKGKRRRTLDRAGEVKVTAKITFTPTGGDPNTKSKNLKLIKRR